MGNIPSLSTCCGEIAGKTFSVVELKGNTVLYLLIHPVVWLTAFACMILLIIISMIYYRVKIITVISKGKPAPE